MKISAGSYDLNKWLYGGYETDIITTIYGPAGSGKTNFCVLASVSQAKKQGKIIFIDTEGGFSVERVKQLCKENHEDILKNIFLLNPVNFEEQKKVFANLLKEIKDKGKISLIVVDGMTMLYRLELAEAVQNKDGEKIKEVNSELVKQMRILAEIARKKKIPVIATNQVYSDFETKEMHMVGGDIMKYWSKCIIEIQDNRGRKKAVLKKHRSLPEKELSFIINNSGVKRRGWI